MQEQQLPQRSRARAIAASVFVLLAVIALVGTAPQLQATALKFFKGSGFPDDIYMYASPPMLVSQATRPLPASPISQQHAPPLLSVHRPLRYTGSEVSRSSINLNQVSRTRFIHTAYTPYAHATHTPHFKMQSILSQAPSARPRHQEVPLHCAAAHFR